MAAGFALLLVELGLMLAGIAMMLLSGTVFVIAGVAIVEAGFFVPYTVVSGRVGCEEGSTKGHAASFYLLFYYIGSSVSGVVVGWPWQRDGWTGVAAVMGLAAVIAIMLAVSAHRRERTTVSPH